MAVVLFVPLYPNTNEARAVALPLPRLVMLGPVPFAGPPSKVVIDEPDVTRAARWGRGCGDAVRYVRLTEGRLLGILDVVLAVPHSALGAVVRRGGPPALVAPVRVSVSALPLRLRSQLLPRAVKGVPLRVALLVVRLLLKVRLALAFAVVVVFAVPPPLSVKV